MTIFEAFLGMESAGGGKVGGVQCYSEFFSSCCNALILLGCVSGILFFRKFWTFSFEFKSGELPGNLKHGWCGC